MSWILKLLVFAILIVQTFAQASTSVSTTSATATRVSNHEIMETLAPREIVVDQAGNTLSATQYPTITTGWFETKLPDGSTTWIPIIYTQTFATTPPEQWPTDMPSGVLWPCHPWPECFGSSLTLPTWDKSGRYHDLPTTRKHDIFESSTVAANEVDWRVKSAVIGLTVVAGVMLLA
ncbi:hypothetical protein EJ08DRAFT_700289 [Tothia fuscella]|uniref:Uncharacterized protein n=1 Tax=Tothia fuscella TaxID=1048955 RepID=A0A9P4TVR7_9PEZI|nr:hypothetical protein EJ08DRAFT_700289 [Tothia fuscella]